MKQKILSDCCNVEIYYALGAYKCGKCNRPQILNLPRPGNFGKSEMPRPKRID